MKKNKNYLVSAIIMFIAAIFFGIVAYIKFQENNITLCNVCLIASVCDFVSFVINIVNYKKKN